MIAHVKPPMLIVDGGNGSGKSTLVRGLHQAMGHTVPIKVRFAGSYYVYDQLAERSPTYDYNALLLAMQAGFRVWQIIVSATPDVASERIALRGTRMGDPTEHPPTYDQRALFLEWYHMSKDIVPTLWLPTEEISIEEMIHTAHRWWCDRRIG